MRVNLRAVDYLQDKALGALGITKEDDFIVNEMFSVIRQALGTEDYNLGPILATLEENDYDYQFDFISALQDYDNELANSSNYPSWAFAEYPPNLVDNEKLQEISKYCFVELVRTDSFMKSLFFFQFLASAFLAGVEDEIRYDSYDHTAVIRPYEVLRPKAVAYILTTEYTGMTIKSVPDDLELEPLNVSGLPPYLLEDNPHIIMKNDEFYLKIDIEKALTAAGGVAQTLERQDLEGTITNRAGNHGKDNSNESGRDSHKKTKRDKRQEKEAE